MSRQRQPQLGDTIKLKYGNFLMSKPLNYILIYTYNNTIIAERKHQEMRNVNLKPVKTTSIALFLIQCVLALAVVDMETMKMELKLYFLSKHEVFVISLRL